MRQNTECKIQRWVVLSTRRSSGFLRLEKTHKGGVSRERATEYREGVMKWQNPRIHDCSLHLENRIEHHLCGELSTREPIDKFDFSFVVW